MEFVKESQSVSQTSAPSPIQLDDDKPFDPKRVWIGNIDTTLAEYIVLKLVQPFGDLRKLDFLYHKNGPDAGSPRGFCFVTYSTEEGAKKAIKSLHGLKVKEKSLIVRLANTESKPEQKSTASKSSSINQTTDKKSQIAALEAKLKSMEPQDASGIKQRLHHSAKQAKQQTQHYVHNGSSSVTNRRPKPYDYRK